MSEDLKGWKETRQPTPMAALSVNLLTTNNLHSRQRQVRSECPLPDERVANVSRHPSVTGSG